MLHILSLTLDQLIFYNIFFSYLEAKQVANTTLTYFHLLNLIWQIHPVKTEQHKQSFGVIFRLINVQFYSLSGNLT